MKVAHKKIQSRYANLIFVRTWLFCVGIMGSFSCNLSDNTSSSRGPRTQQNGDAPSKESGKEAKIGNSTSESILASGDLNQTPSTPVATNSEPETINGQGIPDTYSWGSHYRLSTTDVINADVRDFKIASSHGGASAAAWLQSENLGSGNKTDFHNSLMVRYANDGRSWGQSSRIDRCEDGQILDFEIELDQVGNALAVWLELDQARRSLYFATFDAQSGKWSGPKPSDLHDVYTFRLAFDDGSKKFHLAYSQRSGGGVNLKVAGIAIGQQSISSPIVLGNGSGAMHLSPEIKFNRTGRGAVVWHTYKEASPKYSTWVAIFDSSWSQPSQVSHAGSSNDKNQEGSDPSFAPYDIGLDISDTGRVLVAWNVGLDDFDPSKFTEEELKNHVTVIPKDIWARVYASDGSSTEPKKLNVDSTIMASYPRVRFNSSDQAVVIWRESKRNAGHNLSYSVLNGQEFSNEQSIGGIGPGSNWYPTVARSMDGSFFVAYVHQDQSSFVVVSSRFDPNTGVWGQANPVAQANFGAQGSASIPQLYLTQSGLPALSWRQYLPVSSTGEEYTHVVLGVVLNLAKGGP